MIFLIGVIGIVCVIYAIYSANAQENKTNLKSSVSKQTTSNSKSKSTTQNKAVFICPECNANVYEGITLCTSCGASLERYVTCYKNAQRNDTEAQILLGMYYRQGVYVKKNPKKGFYWTKKAADYGNAHAKLGVACCYLDGVGVEQNFTRALYWLIESRRGGDADAAKKLRQLGIIDAQFIGGEDGLISITKA